MVKTEKSLIGRRLRMVSFLKIKEVRMLRELRIILFIFAIIAFWYSISKRDSVKKN